MKQIILFITFMGIVFFGTSQTYDHDKIVKIGHDLYLLEKCNWISTDTILEKYSGVLPSLGGYLSYFEGDTIKTIYWNKQQEILFTFQFQDSIQQCFSEKRNATPKELQLIKTRSEVQNLVYDRKKGRYFKKFTNTNFNYIPIEINGKIVVYIMTGTTESGVIPLGNDYVVSFDNDGRINKRRIHRSYIPISVRGPGETTIHTHVIGTCVAETDVCIFLLYKDFIEWDYHTIIGKDCMFTWDMKQGKIKK